MRQSEGQRFVQFPPMTRCWVQVSSEATLDDKDMYVRAIVRQQLEGNLYEVEYVDTQNKHSTHVDIRLLFSTNTYNEDYGFEDMNEMNLLNEAEIMYNLKHRYTQELFATYIGPTLLVINPQKTVKNYLSLELQQRYYLQVNSQKEFSLRDQPPHPYGIAAYSLRQMVRRKKHQSIIINGDSGSGKTENTKFVMSFITKCSEIENQLDAKKVQQRLEDRILACNPILEAFGNAKTAVNDNSSRFGRYITLSIRPSTKRIQGAQIQNYMLESSRVVSMSIKERNFHIFYQLLAGAPIDLLNSLMLTSDKGQPLGFKYFNYLFQGTEIKTIQQDALNFQRTLDALAGFQFEQEELDVVFRIISAILFMGNLEFDSSQLSDKKPCSFKDMDLIQRIAKLLQIPETVLMTTLTVKTRLVGKISIESPLIVSDAISNRNSFASNLYDHMFNWLVNRLNSGIIGQRERENSYYRQSAQDSNEIRNIGILDIFGFESLAVNSFEQFCVNYTFEKLQLLYIKQLFRQEELEFTTEDLLGHYQKIHYSDNQAIIDLMDKPPSSIFDLVDESSQLGSGTDTLLYQKIVKTFKNHSSIEIPKIQKEKFKILHSAKPVEYTIENFRNKNKSEVSTDILNGIMKSENLLLRSFFTSEGMSNKKTQKFLGAKYRYQVKCLIDELCESDCHFIRCIRPNEGQGLKFVPKIVFLQIKHLGVLQSIQVRQEGYPVRKEYRCFYEEFYQVSAKYKDTFPSKLMKTFKEAARDILKEIVPEHLDHIVFGKFKFYGNEAIGRVMDQIQSKLFAEKLVMILRIQRYVKWQRKKFVKDLRKSFMEYHLAQKSMSKMIRFRQNSEVTRKTAEKDESADKLNMIKTRYLLRLYIRIWRKLLTTEIKQKKLNDKVVKLCALLSAFCRIKNTNFMKEVFEQIKPMPVAQSSAQDIEIEPTQLNHGTDQEDKFEKEINQISPQPPVFSSDSSGQLEIETDTPKVIMHQKSTDSMGAQDSLVPSDIDMEPIVQKSLWKSQTDLGGPLNEISQHLDSNSVYKTINKLSTNEHRNGSKTVQEPKRELMSMPMQRSLTRQHTQLNEVPHADFVIKESSALEQFIVDPLFFINKIPNEIPKSTDAEYKVSQEKAFLRIVSTSSFSKVCSDLQINLRHLSWHKQIPKVPITRLDSNRLHDWEHLVLQVYSLGGDFIGEEKFSTFQETQQLLSSLIKIPALVDEIYLTTVKQVTQAPIPQQINYARLLVALASSVLPSQKLLFGILQLLYAEAEQSQQTFKCQEGVLDIIKFVLMRFIKTLSRRRKQAPSLIELEMMSRQLQILFPLRIYNTNIDYFLIEPHFTERDLINAFTTRYGCEHLQDYLGLTHCKGDVEEFPNDSTLLVDLLASQESLERKDQMENHFSIKVKVFFSYELTDMDALMLNYITMTSQFLQKRHTLNINVNSYLAQFKYISDFQSNIPIRFRLADYVPLSTNEFNCWQDLRQQSLTLQHTLTSKQAKLEFLQKFELQERDLYMSWQFLVSSNLTNSNDFDTIFAIKPYIFTIVDKRGALILKKHLNKIIVWNLDRTIFKIDIETAQITLTFQSAYEAQSCQELIKTYTRRAFMVEY